MVRIEFHTRVVFAIVEQILQGFERDTKRRELLEDEGEAIGWIARIEWDEGASGLQRTEHDDDRHRLERSDHRHRLLTPTREEPVGDAIRETVELGVRHRAGAGLERSATPVLLDGGPERARNCVD